MTTEVGSITQWLHRLQAGESAAAQEIWNRYYSRIVQLATLRLSNNSDPAVDGEDMAQSAFRAVLLSVMHGNYPDIDSRQVLWKLLIVSTLNRVRRHYRDLRAQKRTVNEPASLTITPQSMLQELSRPEAQVELAELVETLLQRLDQEDPTGELRQIAVLQLEEHSAKSIAHQLKRRKNHVLQRIRWIRILWEEMVFT